MLSLVDNLVVTQSAHNVTAACCLARAEERVRFPLGALFVFRVWESLAFRVLRAHETAGSNPAILTYCGGTRAGTGRRLLTARAQVRFLPPQLVCPWPSGRGASLPSWRGGFDSRRASANGRLPGLEPGDAGSNPAPRFDREPRRVVRVAYADLFRGSCCW